MFLGRGLLSVSFLLLSVFYLPLGAMEKWGEAGDEHDCFQLAVEHIYKRTKGWDGRLQGYITIKPVILSMSDEYGNTLLQHALCAAIRIRKSVAFDFTGEGQYNRLIDVIIGFINKQLSEDVYTSSMAMGLDVCLPDKIILECHCPCEELPTPDVLADDLDDLRVSDAFVRYRLAERPSSHVMFGFEDMVETRAASPLKRKNDGDDASPSPRKRGHGFVFAP